MDDLVEKESILEALRFNILNFFEDDYTIIGTEDSPAVQIVIYQKELIEIEFDFFDTIQLMVMFDKFFVTSDTHINVTYTSKKHKISIEKMKRITNAFHEKFGQDDSKCVKWTKKDSEHIKKDTFNRIWPTGFGDSFVKLSYKKDSGFELSILFLNNLLENIGKKIVFN